MFMNPFEALKLRYSIIGAGRSGISIAKYLKSKGASVFLSESEQLSNLLYFSQEEFKNLNIDFEIGGHTDKVFESDILIVCPGIPLNSDIIVKAKSLGKKVYGEIEVASWFCTVPIVAITGTNGKTTTTALTGEIFKSAGFNSIVCGNIGKPFASVLNQIKEDSIIILEVSSFQLTTIEKFKPEVAIILNITEDHIDWHGSFENYIEAKFAINKNQTKENFFIYNYNNDILYKQVQLRKIDCNLGAFGVFPSIENFSNLQHICFISEDSINYYSNDKKTTEKIIDIKDIYIPGKHNVYNSMAAVLSSKCYNISNDIISNTLKSFKGVEHRIEFVREVNGIKYYNDSKSTNFDSLFVALESFPDNIILIMGGKKGDNKFQMIDNLIEKKVKGIITIGQSKDIIFDHYKNVVPVVKCDNLQDAVIKSSEVAKEGDIVLFSPGYKSFDMFDNYEHRGNEFKKSVNKL